MTLRADTDGTGPGPTGGTVIFAPLAPLTTVTGPNAPVNIFYNPVSYAAPTDFLPRFTLTGGATLTQSMLVFPGGADKTFNGNTSATFIGLKGAPTGVTLVAGPGSAATFDTADEGTNKAVTFNGFSLGGSNAAAFALPVSCCAPIVQKTTANINEANVVVPPPVVVPPSVVVPPPPIVSTTVPNDNVILPYIGITAPAFVSLVSYQASLLPVSAPNSSDVYLTVVQPVNGVIVAPIAPVIAPPPVQYIAPVYAPKPSRN